MQKKQAYVKSNSFKRRISLMYLPILLIFILFLYAGRYLDYFQSPKDADVIIVLSGSGGRVALASTLYKCGYISYVFLSNVKAINSRSGDMHQTALALGIPEEAILTEDEAQSTYQNAQFTLPIMKQRGFKSAIVVSSDFHMRRVKFIFDHVYKKSGIELTYIGSDSGYNAKTWWSDRNSRETTFNEYTKMIGNAFGYNGPEAKSAFEQIKRWFRR